MRLNLKRLQTAIVDQSAGIAFLTLLPFLASGLGFAVLIVDPADQVYPNIPMVYTPWVAIAVCCVVFVGVLAERRLWAALSLVNALLILVMSFKWWLASGEITNGPAQNGFFERLDWSVLYWGYFVFSLFTILAIARHPTLSSALFRGLAGVLALDMVLSLLGNDRSVLRPAFIVYFPSIMSVLLWMTVLTITRMAVKIISENRQLYQQISEQDPRFMRGIHKRTFKLWWPMPLLFVVFALAYQVMGERLINQPTIRYLDGFEQTGLADGSPDAALAQPEQPPRSESVEAASVAVASRMLGSFNETVSGNVRSQVAGQADSREAFIGTVREEMPPRFPGTYIKKCGFLDLACYLQNGVKSMINSAYVSSKNRAIAELENDLAEIGEETENKSEFFLGRFDTRMGELDRLISSGIRLLATGLRYAGYAGLAYAVLILLKSYMIVFARVFFSRVPTASVEALAQSPKKRHGKAQKKGATLGLAENAYPENVFYIVFRACGNNVIDRRRVPQPHRLVIRRLLARNYAMCEIDLTMRDCKAGCEVIVDPPAEIVVWQLADGDEVILDMSTLIGFSRGCRLGSFISLSLRSILFGKAFYQKVSGPGTILLRTQAKPIAGTDKATTNIMQASSLVAWRRDTLFHVRASEQISDTFFSGYSVQKAGAANHMVVYDTSQSRRTGTTGGIIKMTRAFLLPF